MWSQVNRFKFRSAVISINKIKYLPLVWNNLDDNIFETEQHLKLPSNLACLIPLQTLFSLPRIICHLNLTVLVWLWWLADQPPQYSQTPNLTTIILLLCCCAYPLVVVAALRPPPLCACVPHSQPAPVSTPILTLTEKKSKVVRLSLNWDYQAPG